MNNIIPLMTDQLGRYWEQPPVDNILIDDTYAVMDEHTLKCLCDYSRSMPSGVYPGKMWKAIMPNGQTFLRWYGEHSDPNMCSNNQREVLLVKE